MAFNIADNRAYVNLINISPMQIDVGLQYQAIRLQNECITEKLLKLETLENCPKLSFAI